MSLKDEILKEVTKAILPLVEMVENLKEKYDNAFDDADLLKTNFQLPKPNDTILEDFFSVPKSKAFEKYKKDLLLFAEDCLGSKNKLRGYQKRFLNNLKNSKQYNCLASPRQMGKTHLLCIYSMWRAMFHGESVAYHVHSPHSKSLIDSRITTLFTQFIKYGENVPELSLLSTSNDTIKFPYGSIYLVYSISDTVGFKFSTVIFDEMDQGNLQPIYRFFDTSGSRISVHIVPKKYKVICASTISKTPNTIFKGLIKEGVNNTFWKWYELDRWVDGQFDPEKWREEQIKLLGSEDQWFLEYEHFGLI